MQHKYSYVTLNILELPIDPRPVEGCHVQDVLLGNAAEAESVSAAGEGITFFAKANTPFSKGALGGSQQSYFVIVLQDDRAVSSNFHSHPRLEPLQTAAAHTHQNVLLPRDNCHVA